jgi:hypothetical protein
MKSGTTKISTNENKEIDDKNNNLWSIFTIDKNGAENARNANGGPINTSRNSILAPAPPTK